jgi:hypothetical protein
VAVLAYDTPHRCSHCGTRFVRKPPRRLRRETIPDVGPPPRPPAAQPPPLPGVVPANPNLPEPLDDPMRVLRKFTGWATILQLVGVVLLCAGTAGLMGLNADPGIASGAAALAGLMVFSMPYTWAVWRILPTRMVDILYLRAFKYDQETSRIRYDIHKAIGRKLRVSGIRDPRRRWPRIIRFMFLYAFALRYSTPRYLNLEAGHDWKARLWRTLGLAKGALIDVSDLTPYVVAEMRLCYRNMGLARILFIGDGSLSLPEWRELINTFLGQSPSDSGVQVAIWEDNRGDRRRFREAVQQLAATIPPTPAGHRDIANELQSISRELEAQPQGRPRRLWAEVLIGVSLGIVLTLTRSGLSLFAQLLEYSLLGYILSIVSIAIGFLTLWHLALYLKDCGSNRERVPATITFGIAILLPYAYLVLTNISIQRVREAADRAVSMNNLHQLAIAMHSYHDAYGFLPDANSSAVDWLPDVGRPAVSWRVKLLPYLRWPGLDPEELAKIDAIIQGYRTDEPWNSAHNLQFVERMPRYYRFPTREKNPPPGYTYYRVFVTPREAVGPTAVFRDGVWRPRLNSSIPDGTANTILIAEAAEPVIWTDPTDLVFTATGPLPRLGGHFRGVYQVAYADGSVRTLSETLPDFELRARITANGGETVHGD